MKRISESIKRETRKNRGCHNSPQQGRRGIATYTRLPYQKGGNMSSKEEGMAKAVENANVDWRNEVEKRLLWLTYHKRFFTTDDVLVYLTDRGVETHNNSAIGGLINGWARKGYVRQCGFVISTRPSRHKAPIRLWKSNFYRKEIA